MTIHWALVALAVLVFGVRAFEAERYQLVGVLFDDAYISLRHAHNFWLGYGFNFNPGERVEGYTNFLYTALMSAPFFIGVSAEAWIKLVGGASGLALVFGVAALGRPLIGPLASGIVALGLALVDRLPLFAMSGMETVSFASLTTWGFVLAFRQRLVAASLLFALAAMTRMEAVLLYGVAGAYLLLSSTRHQSTWTRFAVSFGAPFGILFGGYYLARSAYYGQLFPNTYYAKVGTLGNSFDRGLRHLEAMTDHQGLQTMLVAGGVAMMATLAILGFRRIAGARSRPEPAAWVEQIVALAGACTLYLLYTIRVGGDAHITFGDRFLYHILPILSVALVGSLVCTLALIRLGSREAPVPGPEAWPPLQRAFAALVAASLALSLGFGRCPELAQRFDGVKGWASLGAYLRTHAEAGDVVATPAAGAIPYFSRLHAIDMFGLADPHIAHKETPGLGRGLAGHEKSDPAYVMRRAPRYVAAWVPRNGALELEGYRIAALVRMDHEEIDEARVLELSAPPSRAQLVRLREGAGAIEGTYSFALLERIPD